MTAGINRVRIQMVKRFNKFREILDNIPIKRLKNNINSSMVTKLG